MILTSFQGTQSRVSFVLLICLIINRMIKSFKMTTMSVKTNTETFHNIDNIQ